MQTPRFIVVEGPDGSGKTTLVNNTVKWLNETIKKPTTALHSPGGTTFATALRNIVFSGTTTCKQAMAMTLLAAETDSFENLVLPSLAAGRHVFGDRWVMSGRVYQSFLSNRPPENINKMIELAMPHPRARPDLYIILNAAPEVLLQRVIDATMAERQKRIDQVKGKGADKKKEEMAQEGDAERQALEGKIGYYQHLWAAYDRPMVFSDGVPCVTFDTAEQSFAEVEDRVREILMQGVLSN